MRTTCCLTPASAGWLMLGLAVAATTMAQDRWLYVTSTPSETVVEIERGTITGSAERVQVNVRYVFGPDQGRIVSGQVAHQALALNLIDCEARTSAVLDSTWLDRTGRIVARQSYLAPPPEAIRPGSTMEAVAEQVCD